MSEWVDGENGPEQSIDTHDDLAGMLVRKPTASYLNALESRLAVAVELAEALVALRDELWSAQSVNYLGDSAAILTKADKALARWQAVTQ